MGKQYVNGGDIKNPPKEVSVEMPADGKEKISVTVSDVKETIAMQEAAVVPPKPTYCQGELDEVAFRFQLQLMLTGEKVHGWDKLPFYAYQWARCFLDEKYARREGVSAR